MYGEPSLVMTVWLLVFGATGVTLIDSVAVPLEARPSLTLNGKLVYGLPVLPATGVNTRLPALMLAAVITWPDVTAVPLRVRLPLPGRLVIVTDDKVSPSLSGSVNGKSPVLKV